MARLIIGLLLVIIITVVCIVIITWPEKRKL